jgi:hypothetical protein
MRNSKKQWQGRCIFCGGGNLSKEHFWPEWASPLLPSYPVNQHVEHSFTVSNKTRANPPHIRNKPGHAWTKKIRVGCETCNNGWMSALETAAKPLLTPLITGTPCVISEADGLTIARWIVLKVLVGEHNIRGDAVATQAQRDAFRATLAIPENFRIWVGRCGVDGWQTAYWRHASTFSTSPDIQPEHRFKNTHSVTFGIGELLVTALHTTVEGLDLAFNYDQRSMMTALLPLPGSITWPSTKILTAYEATFIAHALDGLCRSEKVLWKPLPASVG